MLCRTLLLSYKKLTGVYKKLFPGGFIFALFDNGFCGIDQQIFAVALNEIFQNFFHHGWLLLLGVCACLRFTQIFHHFTGNDQPRHRGNECHTSGDIAALCTFVRCSRRADAVSTAADGHIFYWPCGDFL